MIKTNIWQQHDQIQKNMAETWSNKTNGSNMIKLN